MDRELLWKGKPFATGKTHVPTVNKYADIKLNSLGFRSPEINLEKEKGTYRIVCMGDSSTFGMEGFEKDIYPSVLQRLLEEKYPEMKIEVVNAGYTGYSSFQGLMLLKLKILDLNPDLITIFYGVCDNATPHSASAMTDRKYYENNQSTAGRIREYLHYSKIYVLLEKGMIAAVSWIKTGKTSPRRDFFQNIQESESGKKTVRRVPLDESEENFRNMINTMKSVGIKPILIKHFWLTHDNKDFARTPYHDVMDKIGKETGTLTIDTSKIFESTYKRLISDLGYYHRMKNKFPETIDAEKDLFNTCYIGNVHPTAYGHYLIARELAENMVIK